MSPKNYEIKKRWDLLTSECGSVTLRIARKVTMLNYHVDSGGVYSVLPGDRLKEWGITAEGNRRFRMADGM